jgi:excisionase family DNA binding protein
MTDKVVALSGREPAIQPAKRVQTSALPQSYGVDAAIREVVRTAVREEVRLALREELASLKALGPTPSVDEGAYLSVAEAARVAHVHEGTIRKWIDKGWLPGYRAGRHRRLKRAELDSFMASMSHAKVVDVDERASELAAT